MRRTLEIPSHIEQGSLCYIRSFEIGSFAIWTGLKRQYPVNNKYTTTMSTTMAGHLCGDAVMCVVLNTAFDITFVHI